MINLNSSLIFAFIKYSMINKKFHTNTKYPENAPYFSTLVNQFQVNRHSIEKDKLPAILKLAQGKSFSCKRRNTKYYEKIIVLKVNSPKLKQYLD